MSRGKRCITSEYLPPRLACQRWGPEMIWVEDGCARELGVIPSLVNQHTEILLPLAPPALPNCLLTQLWPKSDYLWRAHSISPSSSIWNTILCMLYIRDIDCERIVDWKTRLCGHVSKGEREIKLKKKKQKQRRCTHGPQLESARILEANDVFGCSFLYYFFFLLEVLNVNIAFTAEQTKM